MQLLFMCDHSVTVQLVFLLSFEEVYDAQFGHVTSKKTSINSRGYFLSNNICILCMESLSVVE